VATAYDLTPLRDREVWRSMWPDERLGWRRSIANLRHAAAIVTISRTAMGEIGDLLGIPETRLHLVYPSLPVVVDEPQSGGAGRAPDHLLFVGAPDPHKNLGVLLRALAAIPAMTRPRLTVVGPWSPAARERLEGRTGRIGLRLDVRRDVPDSELDRLYRSVTLLVVPSRREGFGLPILEAMARGCPVVASDLPVLREVTAGAALHVPVDDIEALGNAIESLIADEGRRHELAASGIRRAATFARERSTDALLECYRSVGIDLAA
jgi:glycosyltransferase involved in cell wall biosynthesis